MKNYKILLSQESLTKVKIYQQSLVLGNKEAGLYLYKALKGKDLSVLDVEAFLELLINTKKPQIFAESTVKGNGEDWNLEELSILGDISIGIPVSFFDNGAHRNPLVHKTPIEGTLIYTPGALLRNDRGNEPADWKEVVTNSNINEEGLYKLYERRLFPAFSYVNKTAEGHKAILTIPGLGCGMFAGQFQGQLGEKLKEVIFRFLKEHSSKFPNIKAVYYDPYMECANARYEMNHLSFLVRPLTKNNTEKSQLSAPKSLEDVEGEFKNCKLYSIVAWDHVSWPGNDFYIGSRATDDGVKAAASDTMFAMTEIEGSYNVLENKYNPPKPFQIWNEVVIKNNITIKVLGNTDVFS